MVSLPKGFRASGTGQVACPHRDVTCCSACSGQHPELVEIGGQHFWIESSAERRELAAIAAEIQEKRAS